MLMPETLAESVRNFRPLRRVEYDRLVEMGAFVDEKVELLEGMLIAMSPQGAPHAVVIQRLDRIFQRALGERAYVRVQMPIVASDTSEPEPDVAIVPPIDDLVEHPKSAHLLIEVADSSADRDLRTKARVYAAARFPELWVFDLGRRCVVVHRAPDAIAGRYTQVTEHGIDATLTAEAFPDVKVILAELLPGR